MLPGNVDLDSPVIHWQSRVRVAGRVVDHLEWDVDRVMCHIPGDTDAAGRSADASVKPAPADPVVTVTGSPWAPVQGWPPRQGDAITIEVSQDGATWFPVITGLADKPSGTLSGDMSVDVVERIDRFTRQLANIPLQARLYPYTWGAEFREIDNHHFWHLNRACETAGFYSTMFPAPNTVFRASMQGSRLPEVGRVETTTVKNDDWYSSRGATPWGACHLNFDAVYTATKTVTGIADLRVMIPGAYTRPDLPSPNGTVSITLSGPSGVAGKVVVNTGLRQAWLYNTDGSVITSGFPVTDILAVRRNGTTWGLDSGTETGTWQNTASTSARPINTITVSAQKNAPCGAIQLAATAAGADRLDTTLAPTALFGAAPNITTLDASPSYDLQAASLMDTIGESTFSHWGFDETGRVVFIPTIALFDRAPVHTISDDTDIIDDVTWSQDWQAAASQIHLDFKVPEIRRNTRPVFDLGVNGGTIEPGDTAVDLIHPDADADWIGVDPGHRAAGPSASAGIWYGSLFIGLVDLPDSGSGPDDRPALIAEYSGTVEMIDPSTWKMTRSATSSVRVDESSGQWGWLPRSLQKRSYPLLRAHQTTTWVDGWIDSSDNGSDAPVVTFDLGKWAGGHADLVSGWLADLLTVDRVMLSELEIRPDPRLQLGDIVTVDLSVAGGTVQGIVTGKHLSFTEGVLTMSISLLVIRTSVSGVSWAAFEDYMSGRTYSQLEARNSSYTALEVNPLGVMGGS